MLLSEAEIAAVNEALRQEVEELSSLSREDLLKVLPEGDFRDPWSCPLARIFASSAYLALGNNPSVLGVHVVPGLVECYAWESEHSPSGVKVAEVELSEELSDFIRRFDAGEYPQLIRPEE